MKQLCANRTAALSTAAALVLSAGLAAPARADLFGDLGLAGGDNGAWIQQVKGPGSLTFERSDYEGGRPPVADLVGPLAAAAMSCKRDGFRCAQLGDVRFDPTKNQQAAEVHATLLADAAAHKTIDSACRAGRGTVQLPVEVRGVCKRVKFAPFTKSSYSYAARTTAPFQLTCVGY